MTYQDWCKNMSGYECFTTYWDDFTIAERFGYQAIKDTYRVAIDNIIDYKYLTELCMVLNHKCNFTYDKDKALSKVYNDLFYECDSYCMNKLKGKELEYFLKTTD